MFKKEQENAAKEELIAEKKASPYVTAYTECDYKGDEHVIGKPENSGDVFVKSDITAGANKPLNLSSYQQVSVSIRTLIKIKVVQN